MMLMKDTGGGGKPPQEEAGTLLAATERGRCERRRPYTWWGLATGCLLVAIVSLGVAILAMEILRGYDVDTLRSQLEALREEVDSLKQQLTEDDLMTELKQFEEAVQDRLWSSAEENSWMVGQPVRAEEINKDDEDEDDDDEDDEDSDAEYYDEYTDKLHATEDKEMISELRKKLEPNNKNTTNDSVREKREIGSGPPVPVIEQSYGRDLQPHNKSEGLRLYESLVTTGGKDPKDPTLDWSSTENPIKDYHRVSPLWSSKQQHHHKKYVGAGLQIGSPPKSASQPTQPPAPIISRVSRVMQTDSNTDTLFHQPLIPPAPPARKPSPLTLRQLHSGRPDGEVVVRVFQEQRGSVGTTVLNPEDTPAAPKPRRKKLRRKLLERSEFPQAKPTKPIAHYHGDTSRYSTQHEHYDGNGRLRHPDGVFVDWAPSPWMQQLAMNRYFTMDKGVVTVKDDGIYMVYAQIYYVDEHDINGYRVYLNSEPMLHCTTMTVHSHGDQRRAKANTCYTSGTVYINSQDTISVRDVNGLRYSLFEPAKSFFGLIKLSDAKIK